MKVGVLGTGFGAYHAELYKACPLVDGVTVWGRDRTKREEIARRLGIDAAENMRELLEDPDIGLMDVCLPNDLHREAILASLEHGKQVFCETPAFTNAADLEAVQAALLKHGGSVYVNQFIKFIPEYRYVRDAAASGRYGRLLSLHVWRKTPAIWGALGFETISTSLMIHDLDFAAWVLGAPEGVHAAGVEKNGRECCVHAGYTGCGAAVTISASSMMPPSYPFSAGFEAVFERAALELSGQYPDGEPIKRTVLYTDEGETVLSLPQANPYAEAIGHVLDCAANRKPSEIGLDFAAAPLLAAIAIRESLHG